MKATTRKASVFSWDGVNPRVLRALLKAMYLDAGDDEQAGKVPRLSDDAARTTAVKRIGSPPRRSFYSDGVVRVLRDMWLPTATAKQIEGLTTKVRLALSGAALSEPVDTKPQQVAFLQRRRLTHNFRSNLQKAFVSAHRVRRDVPPVPPPDKELSGPFDLHGAGDSTFWPDWYPHQIAARKELVRLSRDDGRLRGRLVLPTGAGKTDTIAGWMVELMADQPELRVLWLVHQRELAGQAMHRFQDLAQAMPESMRRVGRVIHGGASSLSTLADPEVSVVAATYQSLKAARPRLVARFLDRPTIVVIDEAHHAGAPTYDKLLDLIESQPKVLAVIGLTATPYPSAPNARSRFNRRFPSLIHEVRAVELIRDGILATPVVTSYDTAHVVALTDAQIAQATAGDIPLEVLVGLDNHKDKWGKTLIFATSIDHADHLGAGLQKVEADVRVLHSDTGGRAGIISWFRAAKGPAVLVSVGMLTEGVDLPDARTAFLARPTTSPILMRQMVGRVLRGPAAGGELEANVVHFRDDWKNLPDVLYPEEVLDGRKRTRGGRDTETWTPGPVIDDDGIAIRADIEAQIRLGFSRVASLFDLDDDDPYNDSPPEPRIQDSRLVGYYDIGEIAIPVLDHQAPGFQILLADATEVDLRGKPLLSYFEDTPPPYPLLRALKSLVEFAREAEEVLERTPCAASLGPRTVAAAIRAAGPLSDDERAEMCRVDYERSLNRAAFSSIESFEQAVDEELRQLRRPVRRLDGEASLRRGVTDPATLPKLPRFDRQLDAIVSAAIETASQVLPREHSERLGGVPKVEWTTRVVETTWGHWSLKLTGRGRGKALIRVNRLLRTRSKHVPDKMLEYLVFHELLHHLLPGQGHDAQFREFEARWPDAELWDMRFDSFHEHWDTRPERYRSDVAP